MASLDQTRGCLLGLALGDAYGAPFEGGIVERLLWRLIGKTRHGRRRWTDDTQMSIDLIESFLARHCIDPEDLAARFAKSYRWSRGYGPGVSKSLKRMAAGVHWSEANRVGYKDGSFGNGAAMRSPMIGLIYAYRPDELPEAARTAAIVTHAHSLGVEGAQLIAQASACVVRGEGTPDVLRAVENVALSDDFRSRLSTARGWLANSENRSKADVVRQLGNGIVAQSSCVTALYLALRFRDQSFVDMQRFIFNCGGDADTIGAMAGAIWGCANGFSQLPSDWLAALEGRDQLVDLATDLHARTQSAL